MRITRETTEVDIFEEMINQWNEKIDIGADLAGDLAWHFEWEHEEGCTECNKYDDLFRQIDEMVDQIGDMLVRSAHRMPTEVFMKAPTFVRQEAAW